jgi:hypothetical protein
LFLDLSDSKQFGFYSRIPIINYKSTDDIAGFKSFKNDDLYSDNTFLIVDDIGVYNDPFNEESLS